MKAEQPPKYLELDAMADGAGNIGTVYRCYNKHQKKFYLAVKIQRGPRTGEWDQPWRFEPLIHWSEAGPAARCEHCRRSFRQSLALAPELREPRCRTCTTVYEKSQRAIERSYADGLDARERRDLLRRPWRLADAKRSTGE